MGLHYPHLQYIFSLQFKLFWKDSDRPIQNVFPQWSWIQSSWQWRSSVTQIDEQCGDCPHRICVTLKEVQWLSFYLANVTFPTEPMYNSEGSLALGHSTVSEVSHVRIWSLGLCSSRQWWWCYPGWWPDRQDTQSFFRVQCLEPQYVLSCMDAVSGMEGDPAPIELVVDEGLALPKQIGHYKLRQLSWRIQILWCGIHRWHLG